MALYLNTNTASLRSQRYLRNTTHDLDRVFQRLSSGLRINSARDDAAGLQISNRMTSRIQGLQQANRNNSDSIAMLQTAEGAMDEMTTMLQTIRTQAIQAASGTNTSKDRQALQKNVSSLTSEISRIANNTSFNGQKILSGTSDKLSLQVGSDAYDTLDVDMGKGFSMEKMLTTLGSSMESKSFSVVADDDARVSNLSIAERVAKGILKKSDVEDIKGKDGKAAFAGYTAPTNKADGSLSITKDNFADLLAGAEKNSTDNKFVLSNVFGIKLEQENGKTVYDFDLSTADSAQAVISNVDNYIGLVDGQRAEFGAMQVRLESTIRNQDNQIENLSDARARIRDTDYASEVSNLVSLQIRQQAAQMMLMQANQRPSMIMQLLQSTL